MEINDFGWKLIDSMGAVKLSQPFSWCQVSFWQSSDGLGLKAAAGHGILVRKLGNPSLGPCLNARFVHVWN